MTTWSDRQNWILFYSEVVQDSAKALLAANKGKLHFQAWKVESQPITMSVKACEIKWKLNKNTTPPPQSLVTYVENRTIKWGLFHLLQPSWGQERWRYEIKFYTIYKFVYILITRLTALLLSLLPLCHHFWITWTYWWKLVYAARYDQ